MTSVCSLALLGTKGGPAIRPGSSMPTSSLLTMNGQQIVIDCGLGVTRGLVDQGMELKSIARVFITHLHSDHYLELGPMLHTAWTAGLATAVDVHGPARLEQYWQGFVASMEADIALRIVDEGRPDLASLVRFHVLDDGEVLNSDGVSVRALRNTHPPLVNTFALSFDGDGRRIVMSGDTAFQSSLVDFARGADLLVHEAMLESALPALFERIGNADDRLMTHLKRSHTAAHDAAKVAADAGVGALALNHLIPSDDPDITERHWREAVAPHFNGQLHVGCDGLVVTL